MLMGIAWALGGSPGGGAGGSGGGVLGSLMLPIAIFVIFYFLLIRPQQKTQKKHKELLSNLKKGDQVVTSGGIYGTITKIRGDVVMLQVADQVKLRVARSAIANSFGSQTLPDDEDDKD